MRSPVGGQCAWARGRGRSKAGILLYKLLSESAAGITNTWTAQTCLIVDEIHLYVAIIGRNLFL